MEVKRQGQEVSGERAVALAAEASDRVGVQAAVQ